MTRVWIQWLLLLALVPAVFFSLSRCGSDSDELAQAAGDALDTDGDGTPDGEDSDDDNDGIPDDEDDDADGDGINDTNGEPAIPAAFAIEPTIAFTPQELEPNAGQESIAVVNGKFNGQTFSYQWDFKKPDPARNCNGSASVLTNGAMTLTAGSNPVAGLQTYSIQIESDWGLSDCGMAASDWQVRFTVGNLAQPAEFANAKDAFAIPERPYTMITVYQGPSATTRYGHKEKDPANTALTAKITNKSYDANTKTLRLKGGGRGEWSTGDYIEIHFNILVNGTDDRNLNSGTLDYLVTKDAFGL